ncbi:MAG: ferrous iron transport protein A [Sphingopyxis sp.]|uniref:FeoA family protein n=1 Tax=Sphingopyxis sp. TaxID=1908224 RepID=UPI003D80DB14
MIKLLDSAPLGVAVRISRIDWTAMSQAEGRRLREFGLMEGVEVTPLHRGSLFSRDPLALTVGRMQVIVRARQAAMIEVEPAA